LKRHTFFELGFGWNCAMPLGDALDPVARWRWLAADAREAAHQSTDPEAKLVILSIAQAYEHLARRAEEGKAEKKSGQHQMT
jgi:hypothetical protein